MPPAPQSSIWIVDDNPLDGSKARSALSAAYKVTVFSDPAVALERLSAGPPDVLLLDWIMPGMSGLEVCRFVRSTGAGAKNLGIVIMTAQTDPEQVAEALAAGADDFVSKPFADVELRARVGGVVRAQTAIARAERAEAEVSRLLASAPDALIVADGHGVVTFVNRQAERALGRPARELEGLDIDQTIPGLAAALPYDARSQLLQLPDITIGAQVYSPGIFRDGAGGKITVSLRDVTERRREEARRLDLYSVVAHDLRSPLASLLMRIDLILRGRRGLLSGELLADFHKMQDSVREQIAILSDFLDLGRLGDNGALFENSDVDLCVVVAGVCEELAPLAEASRVALRIESGGAPALVKGDARRLTQAVTNLVGNALKFTASNSEILVRVSADEESIEVSVKDTGPGLAPDLLPTLFKRYVRPLEGQHDIPGTGLGLMIVREIVERHAGQVAVESQPGVGSTFSFRLPRGPAGAGEYAGGGQSR